MSGPRGARARHAGASALARSVLGIAVMLTRALRIVAFATFALVAGCSGSGPDDNGCCPPDLTMNSCMHLGGYSPGGCLQTCDFFCSTNWRMEKDAHGCVGWRYDTRAPEPGENLMCWKAPGGGDAGSD